jgi:DNA-binding response OmpR family regulator
VDLDQKEIEVRGKACDVTSQEFRLLRAFVRVRGRILSRRQLIDEAWGSGVFVTERVVDTHVWSLRKKIEPTPAKPRFIRTVHGVGYYFAG